jgi:hypothetical protein
MNLNEYNTRKDIENYYLNKKNPWYKYNLYHIYDLDNEYIRYIYYIRCFKHDTDDLYDVFVFKTNYNILDLNTYIYRHYYPLIFKKNIDIHKTSFKYLKKFMKLEEFQHFTHLLKYMNSNYIDSMLIYTFNIISTIH